MNQPTLPDFLLARIAEDEHFGTHDRHLSKRWAVECEAKRRIVEHEARPYCHEGERVATFKWTHVLRLLALPYADHPDYREEWRPV